MSEHAIGEQSEVDNRDPQLPNIMNVACQREGGVATVEKIETVGFILEAQVHVK